MTTEDLLSARHQGEGMSVDRKMAEYSNLGERFVVTKRSYTQQYSQLYFTRLMLMMPRLQEAAKSAYPITRCKQLFNSKVIYCITCSGTLCAWCVLLHFAGGCEFRSRLPHNRTRLLLFDRQGIARQGHPPQFRGIGSDICGVSSNGLRTCSAIVAYEIWNQCEIIPMETPKVPYLVIDSWSTTWCPPKRGKAHLTPLRFLDFSEACPNVPLVRTLDLEQGVDCVLIGTLYKDMKLKPSILDEYTKERAHNPLVNASNLVSDTDFLALEDTHARVRLIGNVPVAQLTTG